MTEAGIARINELYHKSKTVGLTDEEKAEQQALRKEFIADVRKSLRGQLDNMDIENEDGSIEHVKDRLKKK